MGGIRHRNIRQEFECLANPTKYRSLATKPHRLHEQSQIRRRCAAMANELCPVVLTPISQLKLSYPMRREPGPHLNHSVAHAISDHLMGQLIAPQIATKASIRDTHRSSLNRMREQALRLSRQMRGASITQYSLP